MKYGLILIALIFCAFSPVQSSAPQNSGLFDTPLSDTAKENKARQLMFELRCVQCQGQSIADSDAPIAIAMRAEVRRRVNAGESISDIRQFFINSYGEYITFTPEATGSGLLLWLAPLLLLIIALFVAARLFRGKAA